MQSNARNKTSQIPKQHKYTMVQQANQSYCTSDTLTRNNKYGGHWRQGCEELVDE